jgi:hypothetical protein
VIRIPFGRNRWLVLELRARCRHNVPGICPRCYPAEARTRRNRKLAVALAWLERIRAPDPQVTELRQAQGMADHALRTIDDLT